MPKTIGVWTMGGLLLVGGLGFAAHLAGARSQDAEQEISISARKYDFTPKQIRVTAGTKVKLSVHSEDAEHGVKLDLYPKGSDKDGAPGLLFADPAANGKVEKGTDQVLQFTAVKPGDYEFKCAKICGFEHGKMKGVLIVDPAPATE